MTDQLNAFCGHCEVRKDGHRGSLSGLSFAVKDVFDIEGVRACAGNPTWLETHSPAQRTAPAVAKLLTSGAALRGLTLTDELTLGLNGENFHYGTPVNSADPTRVPGGSSSGSASSVAGGAVDCALGTDTGGSIRIPSSYCGIWGMRPTHGRVNNAGVLSLAPSFDTVGWFARNASTLRTVGQHLLEGNPRSHATRRILVVENYFRDLDTEAARSARQGIANLLSELTIPSDSLPDFPDESTPLPDLYRTISGYEEWAVHGAWITKHHPLFGPQVAERFANAAKVTAIEHDRARATRTRIASAVAALLADGSLLCFPTATSVAPPKGRADILEVRLPLLRLTALAGLAGLPQLNVPLRDGTGLPLGVSFVGASHRDEDLLELAVKASAVIG